MNSLFGTEVGHINVAKFVNDINLALAPVSSELFLEICVILDLLLFVLLVFAIVVFVRTFQGFLKLAEVMVDFGVFTATLERQDEGILYQ